MKEEIRFAQNGFTTLKYEIESGTQLVAAFGVNLELIRKIWSRIVCMHRASCSDNKKEALVS